jgi:adenylate kinase
MNLTLFGPPGSGKGTQAAFLVDHFHIPQISTGELLRGEAEAGTDLGKLARTYMDRGELVPDGYTIEVFRRRLARPDAAAGFLLDGFPRTVPQAVELDKILASLGRRMDRVVRVKVPEDVLVSRLSGRLTCPRDQRTYHPVLNPPKNDTVCDLCGTPLVQREDDKPETARRRIKVYLDQTLPVIDHYRAQGVVAEVDGQGEIEEVRRRILEAVGTKAHPVRTAG